MRRLVFLTPILVTLLACSDDDPTGPAWSVRVTGGGMAYNVNTCNVLYQDVSAEIVNGAASGNVEILTYLGEGVYPGCVAGEIWFDYDAEVTDLVLGTAPDGSRVANVCYDLVFIHHEAPFPLTPRYGIAIKEGGSSADMTRRGEDVTCLPGEFWGDDPGEEFQGVMQDGNYTIRER